MIAKRDFKVLQHEPKHDREKIRERIQMLTVREGSCTERWGTWGTHDNFYHYKDRDREPA